MTWTPIALGTKSNPARHGHIGAARHINCYAENTGAEGKEQWVVHACDGFAAFSTIEGGGGIRAALALTDAVAYVVAGRIIAKIDTGGSPEIIGGLPTDGMVTMARNRAAVPQIAIVSEGVYYGLTGDVLTRMVDPDLPPPVSVANINGYFIFYLGDGRHFASELDDWDVTALSFAASAYNPDPGVRNIVRGNEMLFFGTRSFEAWGDVGGDPYPLERAKAVDVGLLGPRALTEVAETVAFVADDFTVRLLDGYSPMNIGGEYLSRLIEATPNDITCTSYASGGHTFLTVSSPFWTWEYDLKTGSWHERKSYGLDRWKIGTAFRFGNKTILGDYATGSLYRLAPGASVTPSRTDQVLMMDYSDDGAATWSTQRQASLGDTGQRMRRARFHRLGMSRSRTYRLSMNCASEAGSELVMTVQTPPVHAEPYRMQHNALNVDVVPGLGGSSSSMSIVSAQVDAAKAGA